MSDSQLKSQRSSWWAKSKTGSKAAFDKGWAALDKLGAPVNRFANKIGSESFWPTSLDKESEKAARILRSFCKDGFYDEEIYKAADGPQQKQRVVKKIPTSVIKNAKGLAIFTTMRTGLWLSGAGGSGIVVARKENGEWSQPTGIMLHTAGLGFLVGVDIYDCVLVLNSTEAVDAFSRWRATVGGEISAVAGPVGAGAVVDSEVHKRQAPIFTYLKSRGFYAGVQIDGTVVIERSDENERFYCHRFTAKEILEGKPHYRSEFDMLTATLKVAQGDTDVDTSLLPSEPPPADYEIEDEEHRFGIPDKDDPDPYGVLALERAGLQIKEAASKEHASPDEFEFRPSVHSPVHSISVRQSVDTANRSARSSLAGGSVSSFNSPKPTYVTSDTSTQTDFDEFVPQPSRGSSGDGSATSVMGEPRKIPLPTGPPPPLPPRTRDSVTSLPALPPRARSSTISSPLAHNEMSTAEEQEKAEPMRRQISPSNDAQESTKAARSTSEAVSISSEEADSMVATDAKTMEKLSDPRNEETASDNHDAHDEKAMQRSIAGSPGPEIIDNRYEAIDIPSGHERPRSEIISHDRPVVDESILENLGRLEDGSKSSHEDLKGEDLNGEDLKDESLNGHRHLHARDLKHTYDLPGTEKTLKETKSDVAQMSAQPDVSKNSIPDHIVPDDLLSSRVAELALSTSPNTIVVSDTVASKPQQADVITEVSKVTPVHQLLNKSEDDHEAHHDHDGESEEGEDDDEVEIVEVHRAETSPLPAHRITPKLMQQARMVTVGARATPKLPDRNPSRLRMHGDGSDTGSIRSFEGTGSPLVREVSPQDNHPFSIRKFQSNTSVQEGDEHSGGNSRDLKQSDASDTATGSHGTERTNSVSSPASSPRRADSFDHSKDSSDESKGRRTKSDSLSNTVEGGAVSGQGLGLSLPEPKDSGPRISMVNIRGGLASHDDESEDEEDDERDFR